jgi:glycosyltransferase involved in cell wall biosynthesis
MNKPAIRHSIVIISFNQEKTIIDAVKSALEQTLSPFELVLLDDSSGDQTVEVARNYLEGQKRYVNWRIIKNEENLGIAKNTKKIEEVVSGNTITLLSGDDRLSPKTIEISNDLIEKNKLDPDKDLFISLSPTKLFYSDRTEVINYKILSNSLAKSIIRKAVPFVKIGFSKNAFTNSQYPSDIGVWADWFWDVSICMKRGIKYYEITTPLYWYTVGIGVGSRSSEETLRSSYLKSAKLILNTFRSDITVLDRLYLLGEIRYLEGELFGHRITKFCGFILYIFNALTCRDMITLKSMTVRYMPTRLHNFLKNFIR